MGGLLSSLRNFEIETSGDATNMRKEPSSTLAYATTTLSPKSNQQSINAQRSAASSMRQTYPCTEELLTSKCAPVPSSPASKCAPVPSSPAALSNQATLVGTHLGSNKFKTVEEFVAAVSGIEDESQEVFTEQIVSLFASINMPVIVARTDPDKRVEFRCHRHGSNKPEHTLDPSKYRKSASKKVGCTFGFNATKPKRAATFSLTDYSKVQLSTLLSSENHGHVNHSAFVGNLEARYGESRKIDSRDVPIVQALARDNLSTKDIRDAVKAMEKFRAGKDYTGVATYKDFANQVAKIKDLADITTQKLTKPAEGLAYLQSAGFIFEFLVDEDQRILAVFWCSKEEKAQGQRYFRVMSTDTCHGAIHGMKSCTVTGVNNEFLTVVVAHGAFLRLDSATHKWFWLMFLKHIGLLPWVLMSDEDPALVAVMQMPEFVTIYHIYCLFHLGILNLPKNLKPPLGASYKGMSQRWWKARNSVSEVAFEVCWECLIAYVSYSPVSAESREKALAYLKRLYDNRHKWAVAWTGKVATLGTNTSGRTEKYQDGVKEKGSLSLLDHVKHIQELGHEFDLKLSLIDSQSVNRVSSKDFSHIAKRFEPILVLCSKYTSNWFEGQTKMRIMNSYTWDVEYLSKLDIDVLVEDEEHAAIEKAREALDDSDDNGYSPQAAEIRSNHSKLISFRALLESVANQIKQLYKLVYRNKRVVTQYFVLLESGASICTCLSHLTTGVLCEHFFSVQLKEETLALFSLDLIPTQWLKLPYQDYRPLGQWIGLTQTNLEWVPPSVQSDAPTDNIMMSIRDALKTPTSASALRMNSQHQNEEGIAFANFQALATRLFEVSRKKGGLSNVAIVQKQMKAILNDHLDPLDGREPLNPRTAGPADKKRKVNAFEPKKTKSLKKRRTEIPLSSLESTPQKTKTTK
ncbi:hypothetical protein HDU99_006928, partial [Rhizoclosmatium hyalinum]